MTKRLKKYTVTSGQAHPLWIFFDQYFSLFVAPLALFIRAIIFLRSGDAVGFTGLIAGIWMFIAILSTLVSGIFLLLNHYWFKLKLNWWKNILLSIVLFLLASFLLAAFIRLTA